MKRTSWLLLALSGTAVWAQPPAPTVQPAPHGEPRIETKHALELDTSTFPPRPRGYRDASDPKRSLQVKPLDALTAGRISALRQRAEADARVRAALGTRFAFLSAAFVDSGVKSTPPPKQDVQLVYFNYASNRAVVVRFSADQVKAVDVRPEGFQPPESDGEVAAAAEIVAKDPRYAAAVRDLPARGILTPAPSGHRYLYLIFKKPEQPAAFIATVDLTAGKVVQAGPVTHQ